MNATPNGNPLLPYNEITLPSGFTLAHKEIRVAPIVAINIWIYTGAIHDPNPHYGLSHFFEHMFFKGTEHHGVGVMDRIITSLGGYNNASTSMDYTNYFVVIPSHGWKIALDVLMDSLLHPLFDPEEIERERSVIHEEIKRREDNPWAKISDQFTHLAFSPTPYQRDILGNHESLQTITRETFQQYHRDRYTPENTTIAIAGDVSLEEIQDELNTLLEHESFSPTKTISHPWDILDEPRDVTIHRDTNQSYLLVGYPMPNIIGTKDEFALDLFSIIAGGGRSSRLTQRLQNQLGLVSSIDCASWNLKYAGLFLIDTVLDPRNVDKVELEIDRILFHTRDSLTEDELQKAKSMAKADFAFSNEKAVSITTTFGIGRLMKSIEEVVRFQEKLENITKEDLQQAFDKHILPRRKCKGLLLPKE